MIYDWQRLCDLANLKALHKIYELDFECYRDWDDRRVYKLTVWHPSGGIEYQALDAHAVLNTASANLLRYRHRTPSI